MLHRPFLLASLAFGVLSFSGPLQAELPTQVDGQLVPSLAPMLKRVTPGVVNISTKTKIVEAEHPLMRDPVFRHFFGVPNMPSQRESSSLGSGVIVDAARGFILTNNHVVDKADEITVTLTDGRKLKAKLVGTDKESDVAVIKVPAERLTEVQIANSDQVQVGDFVVAVGNPFGLGQTVTSGIVSALGRSGLGIEGYEDFIQTDASINPGNSGGALVDLQGHLVGINTAILAPNGGNVGIGFAIPANMALHLMNTLVEHGSVKRGLVGVQVQDLTHELAEAFKIPQNQGAVVSGIQPGSPAEKAKLEAGDVILAVNGRKVKNSQDVRNAVGLAQIGDEVELEIIHKGETLTRTAQVAAPRISALEGAEINPKLAGVLFRDLNAAGAAEGVLIEKMNTASYAFRAGLQPGDVIHEANRKPAGTVADLQKAVKGARELMLNVQRGDQGFIVVLR